MTAAMPLAALGNSGIKVSRLALGSWRTFERIGSDQGIRVMAAARDAGITFLDDARYNDETGRAPIATGYSEVIFGELFRAAGWRRADTLVANKLTTAEGLSADERGRLMAIGAFTGEP
jgi:L-glyceraldehyde 3-phosphate reductase